MIAQTEIAQTEQSDAIISEPPPSQEEQTKLLDAMQRYAAEYVSNLPNFLCTQVTSQYEAGKKSKKWHKEDILTSRLTFRDRREFRNLELVNGKPIKPGRRPGRTPLVTEGEFGILLSRALGDESNASYSWTRWEMFRGRRMAVFNYAIDKQHSTLRLSLSNLVTAVVPYRGSIYADPSTGQVWRVTNTAFDIPPALQTESISTGIDYDEIFIGEKRYLLPVQAIVIMLLEKNKIKNEMEFRDYRKFEADSVITFDSEANPPEQPSEKKDQPR